MSTPLLVVVCGRFSVTIGSYLCGSSVVSVVSMEICVCLVVGVVVLVVGSIGWWLMRNSVLLGVILLVICVISFLIDFVMCMYR